MNAHGNRAESPGGPGPKARAEDGNIRDQWRWIIGLWPCDQVFRARQDGIEEVRPRVRYPAGAAGPVR